MRSTPVSARTSRESARERTDEGSLSYIILKAREDGPYGDEIDGERFTYIGEGVPGRPAADRC